ncbi:small nuclear ribonucleoprotein G [Plasmodium inui San Antonio 1]|uniref:Small nuclear ribonucleoprotein G n=1 Tax=Plasmodium inui San Antonio 1 TaxID=1237626 RepID=W7A745_9APIC|nr:small nuclear ribonucleoprotein G [Plasmodium inui San Antonio 1]EUD67048.1 small nuclear ribonucleoprotein G [Plasmodium inui San Antonio 1]
MQKTKTNWPSGCESGQQTTKRPPKHTHQSVFLNGNRQIVGVLRGYDTFMNLVLDNTVEIKKEEQIDIGIVVIRGNSISYWECLDRVDIK